MAGESPKIQLVSADGGLQVDASTKILMSNFARFPFLKCNCCSAFLHIMSDVFGYQIVTDQQLTQKLQIVTTYDQTGASKPQFILANVDYPNQEKVLVKQEPSPGKVILTSSDGSAVNQLLFASPELAGQQIQVRNDTHAAVEDDTRSRLYIAYVTEVTNQFRICDLFWL